MMSDVRWTNQKPVAVAPAWRPAHPNHHSCRVALLPSRPHPVAPPATMSDPPLARRRILVVDDIPAFLQEMRGILKSHCGNVTICTSPLRALRRLRANPPDLLITTLVMRELGGFEVIRRVRGFGLSLPIVMITGYGNEKTAIEATRLGVSDYLEKPVEPDELRARLEKIFAA